MADTGDIFEKGKQDAMFRPQTKTIGQIGFVYAHCGLEPDSGNLIYAVAAATIGPDGTEEKFDSLVRYRHLTERERYYANVTTRMVRNAPDPKTVRKRLRRFLGEADVLFILNDHNTIDTVRSFCGDIPAIDLSFGAEFFFPQLSAFTLKSLWEYRSGKERKKVHFSAAEVVDLSIDLVRHITGTLLSDRTTDHAPAVRYFLDHSRTRFGQTFCHIARQYQAYFNDLFSPCTVEDTPQWRKYLEKAAKTSRASGEAGPRRTISCEGLDALYRGLEKAGTGFRLRPEQVTYARHVAEALNDRAVLTIEAGTGTGKTQGYLVPALEFLRHNPDARVVISTYTKSLQEQIFQREISFTREALPVYRDVRVALLKGKSSYICAEKLDHRYDEELTGMELLAWLYCLLTVYRFRKTDIDTVGENILRYLDRGGLFRQMLREVSARSGCSPRHRHCPAQVVTAEASEAHLVITNHHKLALLDKDAVLAGRFNNYIIDEANHFETAVRNALGAEVQSREVRELLAYLRESAGRMLPQAAGEPETKLKDAVAGIERLRNLVRSFHDLLRREVPRTGTGAVQALPFDHPALTGGELRGQIAEMRKALRETGSAFEMVKEENMVRMLRMQRRTARRILGTVESLNNCAEALAEIDASFETANSITTVQVFRQNWIIAARRVEMGELIRKQFYERKESVIYTAATLCHRNRFDSFQQIAGMYPSRTIENEIEPKSFRFVRIPSPFSRDAMQIEIPEEAVSGKYDNKAAWTEAVVRLLPGLIQENRGRTLVLFSSYEDLNLVAGRVRDAIDTVRYPLLLQKPGQSTVSLCDEFRAVRESVLFGVDTFWYGVDFKGDTLTQVIITRIPYPPPSDPIQMARKKVMPPDAFWSRYRYDTDIKMRQGIGRLIRCDTDRGKVVILDTRYHP